MPQRTLAETCIVDESNFYMNCTVARQNTRRHANRNNTPSNFVYNKPNDRRKWVVFAALVGNNTIIGPVFLKRSIYSQAYLDLIKYHIVPGLCRSFQQQRNGAFCRVWYMKDGAPAHHAVLVRNRLQELFGNRVVGMGHQIGWPAKSPDFCPLDFCLWGTVKQRVYRQGPPANLRH